MLNWLRGPRPLSGHAISFLNDRFRDNKTYVPFSYFKGAMPDNSYTPVQPFAVTFYTGPYSDQNEGYKKLFEVVPVGTVPAGGYPRTEGRRSLGVMWGIRRGENSWSKNSVLDVPTVD